LHVRLPFEAGGSVAGAPFELASRPLVGEGGEIEAPSATWPARGIVMAGGLAVFHEGVFEYEVVQGRELAVTLARCVGRISAQVLATRPFEAGPQTPTPEAQMLGETGFALGLWPTAERGGLLPAWERFARPFAETPAAGGGDLPSSGTFAAIEGDAQLSSIRVHDGRREARVWNASAQDEAVVRVRGQEHRLGPAKIAVFEF
jgi:hypothetical protein